jgi:hypothetical protein
MRRFTKCLALTAALAGCGSAADPTEPASSAPSKPAFGAPRKPAIAAAAASTVVDQSTLIPVPPPGAVCHADGPWTICHTEVSFPSLNDPVFDLPCGTVYLTGSDVRHGIRWYNSDNKIVKRFVTQDAEGTLSLLPQGAGPTVTVTAHDNWRNVYTVPGDVSSGEQPTHGDVLTLQAPGFGVIAHIAGLNPDDPAGHGIVRSVDDPAVAAKLCAALTR